ncbi:MAG: MmcQ/YjbR family DNA-binding protein [Myxococcales bacterium]|nr:MmcQ/YjbR family DNA-binding protein [Myxococcales bacterium]MCB9703602.1 MmcQ/YjbR family DNA-binding protein [Myxococcales bacterium]MCB9704189.1 MmcQ/YjbR family DNA-binding protein [Myxococcales bacterium]
MTDQTLPPPTSPAVAALRDHALAYPEATEHFPWGERAIKVRGKVFVFLSEHGGGLHLSAKLPQSHEAALLLPFAAPTGYGLGRSGWVSARFEGDESPPVELLCAWIDESYRAIAPRKVVAALAEGTGSTPTKKPRAKPRT